MNGLLFPVIAAFMLTSIASSAQKQPGMTIRWKQVAELPPLNGQTRSLGFAGSVAGMHGEKLLVAGGANFPENMPWEGGIKKYYRDIYVFHQKGPRWVPFIKTFDLPEPLAYAASCSVREGVLFAGGENEKGISAKVYLLQWNKSASTLIIKQLPELPVAVTNASATTAGHFVYVAGGESITGANDQFVMLNLDNIPAGWKQLPPVPRPVSHAVLIAVESNGDPAIYLAGGRKKNTNGISDLYHSVFEFSVTRNQWIEKSSLPFALSAGTGIAAGSAGFLLFGGDKGIVFHQVEALIAAIRDEKDPARKERLNQQKNKLQASHPGFSRDVLLYDITTGECKTVGAIPFETPVTTTVFRNEKYVFMPGGEIRAGVRTPIILAGKLKSSFR